MKWNENKRILWECIEETFDVDIIQQMYSYINYILKEMETRHRYTLVNEKDYLTINKKILSKIYEYSLTLSSHKPKNSSDTYIKPLKKELNTLDDFELLKNEYYKDLSVPKPKEIDFRDPSEKNKNYNLLKQKILNKQKMKSIFDKELETIPEVDIEDVEQNDTQKDDLDKKLKELMNERQSL